MDRKISRSPPPRSKSNRFVFRGAAWPLPFVCMDGFCGSPGYEPGTDGEMRMSRQWKRWALAACTILAGASLAPAQEENATVAQRSAPSANKVSYQMKPVTAELSNTDAQRINADADQDNWRLHGRTYDNQRFSPLTEIDASNVKQLKPVALIQTGVANSMEATPIEIDGVLYVETAGNVVQAYDAVTGEELWSFNPTLEFASMCCGPQANSSVGLK